VISRPLVVTVDDAYTAMGVNARNAPSRAQRPRYRTRNQAPTNMTAAAVASATRRAARNAPSGLEARRAATPMGTYANGG
jgi:hypothetical protein